MTAQTTSRRMFGARAASGALASVLLLTTLSACSNPLDGIVENGVERAVEGATGGTVDLNSDGGLPDGFPVDEVPIVDGEIPYALGLDGESGGGWVVYVSVADRDAAYTEVKKQLTDAGFTVQMEAPDGAFAMFAGEAYAVQVTVGEEASNGLVAQYLVTRQ